MTATRRLTAILSADVGGQKGRQPLARLLRVGLSVETTIHTKFADVVAVARDGREEGPSIPHRHDACPADANSASCE